MPRPQQSAPGQLGVGERPYWSQVLRALREARGVTRDVWADFLGYGVSTVQRWENGEAAPNAAAEAALVELCQEKGLCRRFEEGPLQGVTVTPEWLRDLLAEARLAAVASTQEALGTAMPTEPVSSVSLPRRTNLPAALTPLIGRDGDIAAVMHYLGQTRLLTLSGPGGIGKTRLALAVADQVLPAFADGVRFVDLTTATNAAQVAPAIARAIEGPQAGGGSLLNLLQRFLRDKRLLLVLDNFEQVLDAAALVRELLAACAELRVLLTSRVVLRLPGEREYPVPPLPLPDLAAAQHELLKRNPAVALFVERAQEARPDLTLDAETVAIVAAIVQRLDGLPLAIELAAARSRALPPRALLARLDHGLQLLVGGGGAVPARHRTIRAAIQWSYDLLSPDEQALFRRLAVFAGSCTLAAAEAVCGGAGDPVPATALDVLDGVEALLGSSLLRRADGPGGEPRYSMLVVIREFALEQLQAAGEAEALAARHAAYFSERGEAIREASDERRPARMEEPDAEHENLRAALGWYLARGDADQGLGLATDLHWWFFHNSASEGLRWVEQLLALPGAERPTRTRARALRMLGTMLWWLGDCAAARRWFREAASLAGNLGDRRTVGYALCGLAISCEDGDREAIRLAEEALALFRELDDQPGIPYALNSIGIASYGAGLLAEARAAWEESAASERARAGETEFVGAMISNVGDIDAAQGNWRAAAAHFREGLAILRRFGNKALTASGLHNLGWALCELQEPDTAAEALREGLVLYHRQQVTPRLIFCLLALGRAAHLRGQSERATRLFGAAGAVQARAGAPLLAPSDFEHAVSQRWLDETRATLGEADFQRLWSEGQRLNTEEAVALALAE